MLDTAASGICWREGLFSLQKTLVCSAYLFARLTTGAVFGEEAIAAWITAPFGLVLTVTAVIAAMTGALLRIALVGK